MSGGGAVERVLVAVGPGPSSVRLLQAANRLAQGLHAELFAVCVDDPAAPLRAADRARAVSHLRLADELGARTATIEGRSVATALAAFARRHEIVRIVVGCGRRSRWRAWWRDSPTHALLRDIGDLELHVVRTDDDAPTGADRGAPPARRGRAELPPGRELLRAAAVLSLATVMALALHEPGDLSLEAMVLLLGIVVVSLQVRRAVAMAAVAAAALAFNFCFTAPRWTLAITDPGHLVACAAMFVVGLVVSTLVQHVRERTVAARERELEVVRLGSLVRELAAADGEPRVAAVLLGHLRDELPGELVVLLPQGGAIVDADTVVASHGSQDWIGTAAWQLAAWCSEHGLAAGAGTGHVPEAAAQFLPIPSRRGRVGVFGWRPRVAADAVSARTREMLGTALGQAAAALDRLRSQAEERRARDAAANERLRSTLLQSVSHDLRTPLAAITGAATSLLDEAAPLPAPVARELVVGIVQESRRLDGLIANLLFATRLEAGEVEPRREWTSLEEVVGAALRRARPQLGGRPVQVQVDPGVPLVQGDAVLLEQMVFLLLDNAARHTASAVGVHLHVFVAGGRVGVQVADRGAGIAAELRSRLFVRFERGPHSHGLGLGLAIGAAIARAHDGVLELVDGSGPGAVFRFAMPAPQQRPATPVEPDDGDAGWTPGAVAP